MPTPVLDAVLLSLVLTRTRLRAALLDHCAPADEADQRRTPEIAVLVARLRDPPAVLAEALPALRVDASRLLDAAVRLGIGVISWGERQYPPQLSAIDDPPPVLWTRGARDVLSAPAVAIVGSRTGSPYACAVAERLGSDLARRNVTVISGLARGVDGAAHRGALAGDGVTVGVLGSGVDVVYPREHTALATTITARGALVSELGPGAPPLPHHFPRRNRILSGLSRAVVVVEATPRSGSLITARCAAEQGREVMAVPGNVLNGRSGGAHALIRDGAKIVETADDILEEMGVARVVEDGGLVAAEPPDPILDGMDVGESITVDDLIARSGLAAPVLLRRLTELELGGRIVRTDTGQFVRLPSGQSLT